MRTFVCAAVVLVLCVGTGLAADKAKKGQAAQGVIKKVDAATGSLTVTVKDKKGLLLAVIMIYVAILY